MGQRIDRLKIVHIKKHRTHKWLTKNVDLLDEYV